MDFLKKYRWAALLLCLLAAGGGFLAFHDTTPVNVKDRDNCPNGTKVLSWDTGTGLPADGVIIGRPDQPGCSAPAEDRHGQVLFQQTIRSHRHVRVRGDGSTVTNLAGRRNPDDCEKGQFTIHCLFPTMPSTRAFG